MTRPLRYSVNVTLDGCCDHRAVPADEDLHRHAIENLNQADALLFGCLVERKVARVPPEPPFYFWLAAVPLYGTPLFVTLWAVRKFGIAGERGKATKGLAAGLAAWLALTIAYFAVGFVLEPCLENCSRFRTPEGNARAFALILIYTALAAVIVLRLHGYGKLSQVAPARGVAEHPWP